MSAEHTVSTVCMHVPSCLMTFPQLEIHVDLHFTSVYMGIAFHSSEVKIITPHLVIFVVFLGQLMDHMAPLLPEKIL